MTGVKGRSGSGGKRPGAGRPLPLRPGKKTRRRLRALMLARRDLLRDGSISEEETLAWLVDEKYEELFRAQDRLALQHMDAVGRAEQEYLDKA
jgi:hypothetical protein